MEEADFLSPAAEEALVRAIDEAGFEEVHDRTVEDVPYIKFNKKAMEQIRKQQDSRKQEQWDEM